MRRVSAFVSLPTAVASRMQKARLRTSSSMAFPCLSLDAAISARSVLGTCSRYKSRARARILPMEIRSGRRLLRWQVSSNFYGRHGIAARGARVSPWKRIRGGGVQLKLTPFQVQCGPKVRRGYSMSGVNSCQRGQCPLGAVAIFHFSRLTEPAASNILRAASSWDADHTFGGIGSAGRRSGDCGPLGVTRDATGFRGMRKPGFEQRGRYRRQAGLRKQARTGRGPMFLKSTASATQPPHPLPEIPMKSPIAPAVCAPVLAVLALSRMSPSAAAENRS